MGATKRMSNGEAKPLASVAVLEPTSIAQPLGPHPSTLRVSSPYLTQAAIEQRLLQSAHTSSLNLSLDAHERSLAEAREDNIRLQGVTWLDSVRRALQLPVKTLTTACVYFHKFRLAHPNVEYNWADAAAASLLTSCKNEDTLKKSRDILAAAYNLKQPASHEQVSADDPMFEAPSRIAIGLERLVLESGAFDFRSRSPHQVLVKVARSLAAKLRVEASMEMQSAAELAWTILTDIHRTFAPLKQTSATLALASLELAIQLQNLTFPESSRLLLEAIHASNNDWHTSRQEIMETLLDALDLYTHHTAATILGNRYTLDDFLRVRLAMNKECTSTRLARYAAPLPASPDQNSGALSGLRVSNGHPTPVSPPQADQVAQQQAGAGPTHPTPEGGGTLRFMLNPQRAVDEKAEVNRFYVEEWEEYEEEIEIPRPRSRSRDRTRTHDQSHRKSEDWRSSKSDRDRERDRVRTSDRDVERERNRSRDRERERTYHDRRYDDYDRDRHYDSRRDRDRRYNYDDDSHRRGRDDRR